MRRLAAGVCLVTTRHEGQRHGFVATSVTSLSSEPPSLLVCVNRAASGHDPLLNSGHFCVNVLAGAHERIAAAFSSAALRHTRFHDGRWDDSKAPALLDAVTAFHCRVDQTIRYGTHSIIIGAIDDIRLDPGPLDPLLYCDARFRVLASSGA